MNCDELIAAYTAPGHHYHNLKHIEDCLGMLAGVDRLSAVEREILSAAIWWHDVVYDPTRPDNEELSARLAKQQVGPELRPLDPPDKVASGRTRRPSGRHPDLD
jgi:predicted metal-dependent HD superfamily phosphohydrolase